MTDQVIVDPILNKAAHNFIDAQRDFAKMLINNHYIISKYSMDSMTGFWFPKKVETT